jgi:transcriptional accessory protein Tex/SPT6
VTIWGTFSSELFVNVNRTLQANGVDLSNITYYQKDPETIEEDFIEALKGFKLVNGKTPTCVKRILKELEKPGLDPRKAAKIFEFDPNVRSISDLKTGMILPGIVNNITAFGCFVDLGIKESGLVHISQLKEGYVSDVNEVVKIHQHVQVKVVEVDEARKRIQLTMIL